MSEINITVEGGTSVRLPTAGKYCDRDIVITAEGGGDVGVGIDAMLTCTVTSIDSNATSLVEYACYRLTKLASANLPNCTSIGNEAFYNCVKLESVELPNVTSIGGSAFRLCSVLPSIDLPLVTSIGSNAFRGCGKLQSLILRSKTVCTLGTNVFTSTQIADGTSYIYVPSSLLDSYKTATNWSNFANQFRAIEDYPEITGG